MDKILKEYLEDLYPGYNMLPATNDSKCFNNIIYVGFLKKDDDSNWSNVMSYYWNTNHDLQNCIVTKLKIN